MESAETQAVCRQRWDIPWRCVVHVMLLLTGEFSDRCITASFATWGIHALLSDVLPQLIRHAERLHASSEP